MVSLTVTYMVLLSALYCMLFDFDVYGIVKFDLLYCWLWILWYCSLTCMVLLILLLTLAYSILYCWLLNWLILFPLTSEELLVAFMSAYMVLLLWSIWRCWLWLLWYCWLWPVRCWLPIWFCWLWPIWYYGLDLYGVADFNIYGVDELALKVLLALTHMVLLTLT